MRLFWLFESGQESIIKSKNNIQLNFNETKLSKYKILKTGYKVLNMGHASWILFNVINDNLVEKFLGKKIGKDFLEGKITLPVILLFQNVSSIEKDKLKNIFKQETRSNEDLNFTLELIKKYNIINECYKKAEHFINLASNSLTVFKDSDEKKILESLTSFSLQRTF